MSSDKEILALRSDVRWRGPGLIIFSEMCGVAPSKPEDYARRGWCAYAPNMFWRSEFTGVVLFEEADQAWRPLNAFDWQRAADDARVAVQWLRTQAFSSGICMGGGTRQRRRPADRRHLFKSPQSSAQFF
jgi:dienelactone hydrolase